MCAPKPPAARNVFSQAFKLFVVAALSEKTKTGSAGKHCLPRVFHGGVGDGGGSRAPDPNPALRAGMIDAFLVIEFVF